MSHLNLQTTTGELGHELIDHVSGDRFIPLGTTDVQQDGVIFAADHYTDKQWKLAEKVIRELEARNQPLTYRETCLVWATVKLVDEEAQQ